MLKNLLLFLSPRMLCQRGEWREGLISGGFLLSSPFLLLCQEVCLDFKYWFPHCTDVYAVITDSAQYVF